MAEPFGVAAGALGLATLFTTAVDCFEYIQLGRNFGADYQKAQLKLDIASLRLIRWGTAVNIATDPSLAQLQATETETQKAKEVLVKIIDLFTEARTISSKYKLENKDRPNELQVWKEGELGELHRQMRELAVRRQKGTGMGQKVAWALYRNKHFNRLVEDVSEFVVALESIFPVAVTMRQMAAVELSEVLEHQEAAEPTIAALEVAAEEVDPVLYRTIGEVRRVGHTYKNVSWEDRAKLMLGNYTADNALGKITEDRSYHQYENISVKDDAKGLLGNQYGGKSIFDD